MSELSQVEKLRALGLKSPDATDNPYKEIFNTIEENKSFSEFTTDVQNLSDFDAFETYLTDTIGLTQVQATRFRDRMEQKYSSFSDFQSALSNFNSYAGWRGSFSWGTTLAGDTTDGDDVTSGVRVHGEDGVSKSGVKVGKGTVEIFGPRIEFSKTSAPIDASTDFAVSNLTVSDTNPNPYQTITISADITNNSGYGTSFTAKLIESGSVVKTKTLQFNPSETRNVSFSRTYQDYVYVEVQINDSSKTSIAVVPESLTR